MAEKPEQKVGQAVRHVDDEIEIGPERVVAAKELGLPGHVPLDRLPYAFVKKFRLRRRVEKAVEVSRVVHHPDVASLGRLPVHARKQAARIVLQGRAVVLDPLENGRGDRKERSRRIEAALSQNVMNQVAVQPSVSVLERVNVDEPERERRSREHGVEFTRRAVREGRHSADQRVEVAVRSAHVDRNRHPRAAVPLAHETAFRAKSRAHEARVSYYDTLEANQLLEIDGPPPGFSYGRSPSLDTALRRPFSLDDEARPRVLEQEKGGGADQQVARNGGRGFPGESPQVERRQAFEFLRAENQRAEIGRAGQVVAHAVARRGPAGNRVLDSGVDDLHVSPRGRVRHGKFFAGQPFIQKPYAPGVASRGLRPDHPLYGRRSRGEKQAFQKSEIETFVFESEREMAFKRRRRGAERRVDSPAVFFKSPATLAHRA